MNFFNNLLDITSPTQCLHLARFEAVQGLSLKLLSHKKTTIDVLSLDIWIHHIMCTVGL